LRGKGGWLARVPFSKWKFGQLLMRGTGLLSAKIRMQSREEKNRRSEDLGRDGRRGPGGHALKAAKRLIHPHDIEHQRCDGVFDTPS
jgi:hypothetical protein